MKIIKWLVILLVVLVLGVAIAGAVLPRDYSIERSVTIQAKAEKIHPHVADLKEWPKWMPWWEIDPTIKSTYGDISKGVGATSTWTSEQEGGGDCTITASDPATGVAYDMNFFNGDEKMPSKSQLSYAADGEGTKVTWKMEGEFDGMMGGLLNVMFKATIPTYFDQGLGKLKDLAEAKS